MVFKTQLYEIWKPALNVESYIFFMHSKLAAYFVSRLSLGSSDFPKLSFLFLSFFPPVPTIHLSLSSQWNRLTLCRRHHQPPLLSSLYFFTLYTNLHHSSPTLYLSLIFKAHMESSCFWVLKQCWMPPKTIQGFAFLLGFLDFVFSGFFNYSIFWVWL